MSHEISAAGPASWAANSEANSQPEPMMEPSDANRRAVLPTSRRSLRRSVPGSRAEAPAREASMTHPLSGCVPGRLNRVYPARPEQTLRPRAARESDQALVQHRVGHLLESGDVGAVHVVSRNPVLVRR